MVYFVPVCHWETTHLLYTLLYSCDSFVPSPSRVTLPVYLNPVRDQLLFTVDFETVDGGLEGKGHSFYERGVAITASTLGGP